MQFTHIANPVRVHAAEILDVTDITIRDQGNAQSSPDLMLRLSDGRNYKADMNMTSRHVPVPGDYLVTQEDGYEYLNPKDVFERKYSRPGGALGGDAAVEQAIQAKGKTAPRVTPAALQAVIASEHYFTAAQGVYGATERKEDGVVSYSCPLSLPLLTFCVLVLKNGFTVTGESACASPENFDAEIGRQIARANAEQKIWQLEGYLLKQRLYEEQQEHPDETSA